VELGRQKGFEVAKYHTARVAVRCHMAIADKPATKREEKKLSWIDLINESVHTSDDVDIGDVDAVSRDFIVVKRGIVNVHYYYVPIGKVEGWDGSVLWLKVPEEYVKRNYERGAYPDPTRYYVKDFPGYAAIYPEVEVILPKYSRPVYTTKNTTPENFRVHLCELCQTAFDTEDELSQHVSTSH
jgi:hypothetical protein